MQFKNLKTLTLAAFLASVSSAAWSAPIDLNQACRIAAKFRTAQAARLKKAPVDAKSLSLVYTAQSQAGDCFYILNTGTDGGYTIVAADDRIPEVLGYSENGAFDPDRIPDNMKWWLNEYKRQIEFFLQNEDRFNGNFAKLPEFKEIKPLLTSQWNQSEPFNNMCPMDGSKRSVTGCVATAMAQVMRHHQWPVNPTGSANGVTFSGTTLDWANMIDVYESGKYSQVQADAVALLMRQCGASVSMMYSSSASGAYSPDVVPALYTYFGYNKAIKYLMRDYYSLSDWSKIIHDELADNRPVYYSGQATGGGHAFVCDGYQGNGYFHFNWGWGGYQDGYFRLYALNPDSGGIGSYEGGYNSNQAILAGVRKATADDGPYQCLMIANGGYLYSNNNGEDRVSFKNAGLFYNPTGRTEKLNIGFKLQNINDSANIKYFGNFSAELKKNYGYKSVSFQLPSDLKNGQYRLTIVYKDSEVSSSVWQDIMIPYGETNYILVNKTSSGVTFTTPKAETGANLIVNSIEVIGDTIFSDLSNSVKLTISNVSDFDFQGNISMNFYRESNMKLAKTYNTYTVIPAKSSSDVYYDFYFGASARNYILKFSTEEQDSLGDPFKLKVNNYTSTIDESSVISAYIYSPSMYTIGSGSTILEFDIMKSGSTPYTSTLGFRLIRQNDKKIMQSWKTGSITFSQDQQGYRYRIGIENIKTLTAGNYYWQIYDASNNKIISDPLYMKVTEGPLYYGDITFRNIDENVAEIMPSTKGYKGDLVIPEIISDSKVKAIAGDAFTFSEDLTALTLPENIGNIANAQFFGCSKMEKLTLNSKTVPAVSSVAFAPDAPSAIELKVNENLPNLYKRTKIWDAFFFPSWNIQLDKNIRVISGLINDSTGSVFSPYYINRDQQLSVKVVCNQGDEVSYEYTIGNGEKMTKVAENGMITLPALGKENGTLRIYYSKYNGINTMSADTEDSFNVFTLDGLMILKNAPKTELDKLPKGIYIINGKKTNLR